MATWLPQHSAFAELGIGEIPTLIVNQTTEAQPSPTTAIKPISNMSLSSTN